MPCSQSSLDELLSQLRVMRTKIPWMVRMGLRMRVIKTGEVVDEGKVGQLAMEPFFSFLFYEYKILLAPNKQTTKEQSP